MDSESFFLSTWSKSVAKNNPHIDRSFPPNFVALPSSLTSQIRIFSCSPFISYLYKETHAHTSSLPFKNTEPSRERSSDDFSSIFSGKKMEHRRGNSNSNKKKEDGVVEEQVGFPVHNQVKKIKQESCYKILDWLPAGQPEMRPVVRVFTARSHQVSRSPLGLAGRPISVGDS